MRQQLVRVITNRQRLEELYGKGYFERLLDAVADWKSALALEGIVVEEPLVLSDELPPANAPGALKERLACLNRKPADAVVILGGPTIVPFFSICAPEFLVPPDQDAPLLSDDPYVAFDRHNAFYKPECAIGRLPDGGPDNPDLLIDLLMRSTAHHRTTAPQTPMPLGLTEALWRDGSGRVFGFSSNSLYTCPPYGLPGCRCVSELITPNWLQAFNLHYYNAHGTPSNTLWYARCDVNGCNQKCDHPRIPLLMADVIPALANAWIFSPAGYSACLTTPTDANLALQFLRRGAICYIGSTAATYSAQTGSALEAADRMAQAFFDGLHQNMLGRTRLSIGELVKRAKLGYTVRDGFDCKTVVEFVLFGDPTLVPFRK